MKYVRSKRTACKKSLTCDFLTQYLNVMHCYSLTFLMGSLMMAFISKGKVNVGIKWIIKYQLLSTDFRMTKHKFKTNDSKCFLNAAST